MPLSINLLAEAQALEEMRRRDPVKRAIAVGVVLVALVLIWSGYLQSKAMVAARQVNALELRLQSNTNEYQQVLGSKKKLDDAALKLARLQQLTTNRFLSANVLDALQHVIVEDVQLVQLRTDHHYTPTAEVKNKTNENGVTIKGKPATIAEKITLMLDAKDSSDGDQWVKFKTAVADCKYFQTVLGKKHEVRVIGQLQQVAGTDGKRYAQFKLECTFPEKTR
jgi:hypothetical protein